jgi:ParB family chromosome partitioning protein
MHLTTVPLGSLLAPKGNPRRTLDNAEVRTLARSIAVDGVLQNLIVRREGDEAFRVVSGKRRWLALKLLKKQGAIDETYQVPVEIKDELTDDEALRLATVENVQREQLHPIDEAEAFAKLLQNGGTIEAIVEKTGLSAQTVKRRLALASLAPEAKKALRDGTISRSIAEALTIGSHARQRSILEGMQYEDEPDADDIHRLLSGKPNVAMALFPREQYIGAIATDLFADEETTYFEDVDEFMRLQQVAVDELAEQHRAAAAWVDVLNLYTVPWWQYRQADEGEPSGVVINLHPSGSVEIREGLARHRIEPRVVEATQVSPVAPRMRERSEFTAALLEYIAHQRSAAVQAALLANPRKAKEVGVLLLVTGLGSDQGLRLSIHGCHFVPASERDQRSYRAIDEIASRLADRLELTGTEGDHGVDRLSTRVSTVCLYESIGRLSDDELDRLIVLLPILCFGQRDATRLDTGESLMNRVAVDLSVGMRTWWKPDAAFLSALRRDQIMPIAVEVGAAEHLQGLHDRSKKDIIEALAAFFGEQSDPAKPDGDRRAKEWLPGVMDFPATKTLNSAPK